MFSYDQAFARNVGWVTEREQHVLRSKRVAIAGLGGTGGQHVTTLARLGIGGFKLADLDRFEVVNMNRQAGAFVSTLGKPKVGVMAATAREINPDVELELFEDGVQAENVDRFLEGVDLYVDALDFFAFGARKLVFRRCAELGIPAITAAPLGMSAALVIFMPGSMTFDDYFGLDDAEGEREGDVEQAIRFLVGLAPAMLHRTYLADVSRVQLGDSRGPSLGVACQLCAALASVEALKILLGRGRVLAAPHALQFDAYRHKLVTTHRPFGARNPLQRIAAALVRRQLATSTRASRRPSFEPMRTS